LTKRGEKFEWTAERDNAFETLKDKLVTAPIVAMTQDTGDYKLDDDARNWSVGAVLQQEQDGLLHVIGYASKTFTATKQRYCITRKELAGMVIGLKHYRQYLLGHQFTIRTDHAALSYILTAKDLIGKQARWINLMSEFTFTIQHHAGTSHTNADALSRILPCEIGGKECRNCHKHIRHMFDEDTTVVSEARKHSRARVLRLTLAGPIDSQINDISPVNNVAHCASTPIVR